MPSNTITMLTRHIEHAQTTTPVTAGQPSPTELPELAQLLATVPDPRDRRGRRHRIGSLLALCLIAVMSGARSLASIGRFARDSDPAVLTALGLRCTRGRQHHRTAPGPPRRRRPGHRGRPFPGRTDRPHPDRRTGRQPPQQA
ncbi:hypothetical protein Aple_041380 [Acrocarpospora pleiomorpha]|uniref:H repeat-associated protein N-terminal domain-containing protein n=1 Tax=Acrocarpospora pleiomorpha TaxID=90975 RepID=A0A5M3XK61_9ACTN|nr:transposase family protein [Acrocarpospora pleiomorpha]GES21242.1 hypothetical protein Aple_041380 [Acrocarpospora pleiomorpha]